MIDYERDDVWRSVIRLPQLHWFWKVWWAPGAFHIVTTATQRDAMLADHPEAHYEEFRIPATDVF